MLGSHLTTHFVWYYKQDKCYYKEEKDGAWREKEECVGLQNQRTSFVGNGQYVATLGRHEPHHGEAFKSNKA